MTPDLAASLQCLLGNTYRLESELVGGGMSRVFVAEEPALRRKVVVKVLPPDLVSSTSLARFQQEIEVTARLQHPHILPIVTAGSGEGLFWYIAPFIEGRSLGDRLAREGRLPRDEALRIIAEVTEAVAFAHARGVVHRDIKPGNVLLHEGHAVLADFGVALALFGDESSIGITGVETHAALAAYLPPDKPGGEGADCWALGVLAHELLTGAVPHLPVTARGVLAELGGNGSTDRAIAEVLAKALAVESSDRFASAEEFRAEFARVRSLAHSALTDRTWRSVAFVIGGVAVVAGTVSWVRARVLHELPAERPIAVVVEGSDDGAAAIRAALEGALREWREVAVAAERETRGVQRLVVRRTADGVSLSSRLIGSNGRPIAILERMSVQADVPWEDRALRALAREAASQMLRGGSTPLAWDAPSATLSLAAWREHDAAVELFRRAELTPAIVGFRRALRIEPSHRAAQARLAIAILAADDSASRGEAELLLREAGVGRGGPLPRPDSLRRAGWLASIERDHASACSAFDEIVRIEPDEWDGWLGLGECRRRDDRVIASATSPTGWLFVTGFHGAALAYERADLLAGSRAPVTVYHGLARTLPAIIMRGRNSRALADGSSLFALPRYQNDTLAHFPEPTGLSGWDSTSRRAVAAARARLHAIALRHHRAMPDDPQALLFLANILEQQGIIDRPRTDGVAALMLVRSRRERDPKSALSEAWREARLLLRVGALGEALTVAQRALGSSRPRTTDDEVLVAQFAALTGDSTQLRSALQRIAALESRMIRDRSGPVLEIPMPVEIERARFLAPAFIGLCNEDVRLGFARIERAITAHIAEPRARMRLRDGLADEAAAVASSCIQLAPPSIGWRSFGALAGEAVARGDAAAVREMFKGLNAAHRFFLPGESSWEIVNARVWAGASIGDTASAYNIASSSLTGIANHPIEGMDRLEEIAALRRLILLTRRLAVAVPDADLGDWWLQDVPGIAPVRRER